MTTGGAKQLFIIKVFDEITRPGLGIEFIGNGFGRNSRPPELALPVLISNPEALE